MEQAVGGDRGEEEEEEAVRGVPGVGFWESGIMPQVKRDKNDFTL
jgi:hypothetical protein